MDTKVKYLQMIKLVRPHKSVLTEIALVVFTPVTCVTPIIEDFRTEPF